MPSSFFLKNSSPSRTVFVATLFVVFVCLSLLGIDGWLALRMRTHEIRQATVAQTNLTAAVAQQMDSMFSEVANILSNIVYELERDDLSVTVLDRLQPVLVNQATMTKHVHDVFVYSAWGAWLATSQAAIPALANNSDREYFVRHRDNQSETAYISKPVVSRSTGVWILPVSRRFNDRDGNFAGVVMASIRVDHVLGLISGFQIGQHGALALMREDGVVLTRRPFAIDQLGTSIAGSAMDALFAQHDFGTGEVTSPIDGVKRLVSYRHIKDHPLVVAVAVSKHEMLDNWRATTYFQTGWILVLCLFTGLAGAQVVRSVRERLKVEVSLGRTRDELTDANAQLAQLARVDALTALPNRRCFDEVLELAFADACRSGQPMTLVMLDVDYFKRYNDLYGHPEGDRCLQQVAQAIESAARRPRDFVARYGGEEMVMVLPDTDAAGAVVVAEAARRAVMDRSVPHAGNPLGCVSISAGAAVYAPGRPILTAQDLLREADLALYEAKERGRNQVVIQEDSQSPHRVDI
jgi:diguanylate cyclase (GGDEF)-like protein